MSSITRTYQRSMLRAKAKVQDGKTNDNFHSLWEEYVEKSRKGVHVNTQRTKQHHHTKDEILRGIAMTKAIIRGKLASLVNKSDETEVTE